MFVFFISCGGQSKTDLPKEKSSLKQKTHPLPDGFTPNMSILILSVSAWSDKTSSQKAGQNTLTLIVMFMGVTSCWFLCHVLSWKALGVIIAF